MQRDGHLTEKATDFPSELMSATSTLVAMSSSNQSEYISSLSLKDDKEEQEVRLRLRRLKDERAEKGIAETKLFIENSNDSNIQLFCLL